MQYLSWADVMIPLCFVTGFSYAKRARIVEHRGGFVSSRGLEATEISVRVALNRSVATAYGVNFEEWIKAIEQLSASKSNEAGTVALGGYPIYPELNFALTNINRSHTTDLGTNEISTLEADITLSGVSCVKEVSRERALVFDDNDASISLPKVTIECKGKSLVVQDSLSVARFETAPDRLDLELFVGQDSQNPERDSFFNDIMMNYATVLCELPQGNVTFNVISCMQIDNILYIEGSIFPEAASQTITRTFVDCDIADILQAICDEIDVNCDIQIEGGVDYYLMNATPLEAIKGLQNSAGFIVSRQGNRLIFAWLPDTIEPQKTLDLVIADDSLTELTCGVVWRDGIHEVIAGEFLGEVVEIVSVFRSGDGAFAEQTLRRRRYTQSLLRVEDLIDDTIVSHSQIALLKNNTTIPVLVDYPSFNWLDGIMSLECREIR